MCISVFAACESTQIVFARKVPQLQIPHRKSAAKREEAAQVQNNPQRGCKVINLDALAHSLSLPKYVSACVYVFVHTVSAAYDGCLNTMYVYAHLNGLFQHMPRAMMLAARNDTSYRSEHTHTHMLLVCAVNKKEKCVYTQQIIAQTHTHSTHIATHKDLNRGVACFVIKLFYVELCRLSSGDECTECVCCCLNLIRAVYKINVSNWFI